MVAKSGRSVLKALPKSYSAIKAVLPGNVSGCLKAILNQFGRRETLLKMPKIGFKWWRSVPGKRFLPVKRGQSDFGLVYFLENILKNWKFKKNIFSFFVAHIFVLEILKKKF